jgi:mannonate dehydratase
VTGPGDATLNGQELAVASYLGDHLVALLIGKDPARIEDMWQYLYRGAYWRRGPVTTTAIAAVDTALWDIKSKVAGLPVYQLLGGRSREGVPVYSLASGSDAESLLDDVALFRELGYWPYGRRPRSRRSAARTVCARAPCTSPPPPRFPMSSRGPRSTWTSAPAYLEAVRDSSGSTFTCTTCITG